MHHSVKLCKTQCVSSSDELEKMSQLPCALAIGLMMWAMRRIRPDVAYALTFMSRYQENLGLSHWTVANDVRKKLTN